MSKCLICNQDNNECRHSGNVDLCLDCHKKAFDHAISMVEDQQIIESLSELYDLAVEQLEVKGVQA